MRLFMNHLGAGKLKQLSFHRRVALSKREKNKVVPRLIRPLGTAFFIFRRIYERI